MVFGKSMVKFREQDLFGMGKHGEIAEQIKMIKMHYVFTYLDMY